MYSPFGESWSVLIRMRLPNACVSSDALTISDGIRAEDSGDTVDDTFMHEDSAADVQTQMHANLTKQNHLHDVRSGGMSIPILAWVASYS